MAITLLVILTMALAAIQAWLPSLWWFGGLRIELLPALVAYGALVFHRVGAVALAIGAGLAQDCLSAAPFGISALAYAAVSLMLFSIRDVLDREMTWVQMGAGAVTAATCSVAACLVVGLSIGAVLKIVILATMSAVMTSLFFITLEYVRPKLV